MTLMEYVARFTELACFGDDYVVTNMAKVKRFKSGPKLFKFGCIIFMFMLHNVRKVWA